MNTASPDLDLSDCTTQELEVIQLELQEFLNTKAYHIFLRACETNKAAMVDMALHAELKGVESLFSRESVFGESLGWSNMKNMFTELLEEVSTSIKNKNKPTP